MFMTFLFTRNKWASVTLSLKVEWYAINQDTFCQKSGLIVKNDSKNQKYSAKLSAVAGLWGCWYGVSRFGTTFVF